jgi:hypothetical protein
MLLLNKLSMPMICISSSSIPIIHRFCLLLVTWWPYIF